MQAWQRGVVAGGAMGLQRAQGVVVAGVQRNGFAAALRRHLNGAGKGLLQFGAQMLHLGRQPRLRQSLGVEQALAKRRAPSRLATLPDDQLVAHFLFPGAQLPPHMAVRQANGARGGRYRALVAHRLQHVHHRVAQQGCAPGGQGG